MNSAILPHPWEWLETGMSQNWTLKPRNCSGIVARPAPRPVGKWLQGDRNLAALFRRCQLHERLLQIVRRNVPETLAPHCLACVLDSRGRLTLYVTSPVWASRLRYCQPAILAALRSDFPVRRFQIRIGLPASIVHRPPPRAKIPPPTVVSELERSLSGLPDKQLRRSLGSLIAVLRQQAVSRDLVRLSRTHKLK